MQLLVYTRRFPETRPVKIRTPPGAPTMSLSRAFDTPGVRADLVADRLVTAIYGPFPLENAPISLEQLSGAPLVWQR